MKQKLIYLSLAFWFLTSIVTATELSTNDGERIEGEFVSIDSSDLIFKTKDGERKFLLTSLNLVDLKNPSKGPLPYQTYTLVELIDGSTFRCQDFSIKKKTAYLTLFPGPGQKLGRTLEIPWEKLSYFYKEANNLKTQQEFLGIMKNRPKADLYLRKQIIKGVEPPKGGEPPTRLEVAAEGIFGDGTEDGKKIAFKGAGVEGELPSERVAGIIYNPTNAVLKGTICRVIDTAENSYVVHKIEKTDKGYTIATLSDLVFTLAENEVSRFDFAAGGVKYLSDLDPSLVKTESTASEVARYQRDKNLDGKEISLLFETKPGILERKKFDKGLTIPTKTILEYDLKGQYKTLKATVGVDAMVESEVAVKFSVINVDSGVTLHTMIVKKGEKPVELNLGITGVGTIRLVAESTDPLDFGQQISLARARVEK